MAGLEAAWAAALDLFVARHGYVTLFTAMFLEGFGLPLPSELLFIPAGFLIHRHDLTFGGVLLAATLGGLGGNAAGYAVARLGGKELISRYGRFVKLGDDHLNQFRAWISRHGGKTIFISRFFGPIRAASIVGAGVGRMPIGEYLLYQAAAGLVWNFTWAFAAKMFGRRVARLIDHFGLTSVLVGGVAVVLALVVWWLRTAKQRRGV